MSTIVLITGSPRKNGNTNKMADSFEKAAMENGHEIIRFDAAKLNLSGCRACNACFKNGACAIVKEFNPIADAIIAADGLVMCMPVYWYNMPTQIKAVLDHFYAFSCSGRDFSGKKAALISCCEEDDPKTLSGVVFAFDKSMELLKADIVGKVLVTGAYEIGDIDKTDGVKLAAELVEKF